MTTSSSSLLEKSIIDNPFADPAIQQINRNSSIHIQIDEYTPFGKEPQTWMAYNQSSSQPAIMQVSEDNLDNLHNNQQAQQEIKSPLNTNELLRRHEELQKREEELAQREKEIRQNKYQVRHKNWPPLPTNCCCQPCFYQDIQVDIPLEFQNIVYKLYYLWIFHVIVMILNISGGIVTGDLTIIGMGICYIVLFTPCSYLCWFRPAYKAFRSDSSFNFIIFFFMLFFQFIVTIIQTIGFPSSGTIGIITALSKFKDCKSTGGVMIAVFYLIIAVGFGFAAAADLSLISKIHHIYQSSGASLAKAQAEFTSEFLQNQHVLNAATNLANLAQSNSNRNN